MRCDLENMTMCFATFPNIFFTDFFLFFRRVYSITSNIEPWLFNGKTFKNFELEYETLGQDRISWTHCLLAVPLFFSADNWFAPFCAGQFFRSRMTALVSCLSLFVSMLNVSRPGSFFSCVRLFAFLLPSGGQK